MKERELTGVPLIIGDKNLGMLETIPEVFPDARYQRCTVHFYRNIFSVTPQNKMNSAALMPKAIHSQESKKSAREKAIQVSEQTTPLNVSTVRLNAEQKLSALFLMDKVL